jgi:hypothetical protein
MVTMLGKRLASKSEREENVSSPRRGQGNEGRLTTLKDEVLNDEVDLLVGVLNPGDGDVADLVDERGKDLVLNVVPELGLEGEASVVVLRR